jgi:hypothetical protein
MKRSVCLALMRMAGYHGDKARLTVLLIEGPVSRSVAEEMFRDGAAARAAGVPCHCFDCSDAQNTKETR